MQNISADDLETVTGGTTGAITGGNLPSPHPLAGSTGSTGTGYSSGLLTSLNSISDSIKGLSNNNNGMNSNTMLMFGMALAMRNRSEAAPVVVNYGGGYGGGWGHGGFSFHAHW
ncbi:MAG: hypothetical protein ABJE66_01280 [Deltaproteobacteria bacterium]